MALPRPEDELKPGPRSGQTRNFVAPNNGSLGGRPNTQPSSTASPMETLPSSLPPIVPPPQPAPPPTIPGPQAFGASGQPIAVNEQAVGPAVVPPPQTPQPVQPPMSVAPGTVVPPPTPQPTNMQLPAVPKQPLPVVDGSQVTTPLGTATITGGAPGNFNLSEQGRQAYAHAKIERVKKFGAHPWVNDPKAPPPPVEPGRPAFNPMTGEWSED